MTYEGVQTASESHIGKHCETAFYTLTFSHLAHVFNDLEQFGYLQVLDASPFEMFSVLIKEAYKTTSQRQSSGMVETVVVTDIRMELRLRRTDSMLHEELSSTAGKRIHIERTECYLVQDGKRTTLIFCKTLWKKWP